MTSASTSRAKGGRPARRCGYVQRRATSRWCQRSSVRGLTENADQARRGSRPTQRSQEQPVRLSQLRPPPVPAQDRELVPQHKDLQLLRSRRPATEQHQLEQTANDQVRERPQHARPPPEGEADATRPPPQQPP